MLTPVLTFFPWHPGVVALFVNDDLDGWSMDSSEGGIAPILTVDYTTPAFDTTYRVNSETAEEQVTAETGGNSVARAANGNSIVVWHGPGDGSGDALGLGLGNTSDAINSMVPAGLPPLL